MADQLVSRSVRARVKDPIALAVKQDQRTALSGRLVQLGRLDSVARGAVFGQVPDPDLPARSIFFNLLATTDLLNISLHDSLPIC